MYRNLVRGGDASIDHGAPSRCLRDFRVFCVGVLRNMKGNEGSGPTDFSGVDIQNGLAVIYLGLLQIRDVLQNIYDCVGGLIKVIWVNKSLRA